MSDKIEHTPVEDVIKVSSTSNPSSVGSILARSVNAGFSPKLRAVGAGAVNQATKACAIARGFVAPRGVDLTFVIGFDDIKGDSGDTISAMTWTPVARH